jgi:hypothetical protein
VFGYAVVIKLSSSEFVTSPVRLKGGVLNQTHRQLCFWRRLSSGMLRREVRQKFTDVSEMLAYFLRQGDRPDDGGSKHLWIVSKLLPVYTAQHPRRHSSSYSPPWDPEISTKTLLYFISIWQYYFVIWHLFTFVAMNLFSSFLSKSCLFVSDSNELTDDITCLWVLWRRPSCVMNELIYECVYVSMIMYLCMRYVTPTNAHLLLANEKQWNWKQQAMSG